MTRALLFAPMFLALLVLESRQASAQVAELVGAPLSAAGTRPAGVSGSIEICRVVTSGDRHSGVAIEIPSGAAFGDAGEVGGVNHGGRYWPVWIATLAPARIEATASCGTAVARITGNLEGRKLRAADRRLFIPSSVEAGALPGWPGNLALTATALGDFK